MEFSSMANNNGSRAEFVEQAVKFVKKNNFDGLDINWDYPGQGIILSILFINQ